MSARAPRRNRDAGRLLRDRRPALALTAWTLQPGSSYTHPVVADRCGFVETPEREVEQSKDDHQRERHHDLQLGSGALQKFDLMW